MPFAILCLVLFSRSRKVKNWFEPNAQRLKPVCILVPAICYSAEHGFRTFGVKFRLYIKQSSSSYSPSAADSEDEWAEYKIKETNMFTADKYQQVSCGLNFCVL